MREIDIEIGLGVEICLRLKVLFYKADKWEDCHEDIARRFSALKKKASSLSAGSEIAQILNLLIECDDDDIENMFKCSTWNKELLCTDQKKDGY